MNFVHTEIQPTFNDFGFRVEPTGDGSPTLRMLKSSNEKYENGESMHHSQGAYTETEYIYGTCIREALSKSCRQFIVVGLGLGYIELLIVRELLANGISNASILSFESVDLLRQNFVRWSNHSPLNPEIENTYNKVAEYLATESIPAADLRRAASTMLETASLKLVPSLEGPFVFSRDQIRLSHGTCILYDAFSKATDSQLWEEEFLVAFLQTHSGHPSFLSTYACTGNLKRALKRTGYQVEERPGFSGKRLSIIARLETLT
jgi:hypothetical protein